MNILLSPMLRRLLGIVVAELAITIRAVMRKHRAELLEDDEPGMKWDPENRM